MLSKSIGDVSWSEFNRQLEYKCKWSFKYYLKIGRFEPTSKTCSNCGCVQEMPLNKRVFDCQDCGISIDRDLNASLNIRNIGLNTLGHSEIYACGDSSLELSLKQEKECFSKLSRSHGASPVECHINYRK